MDKKLVLLTPTGARPEQFALCARWMKAQDYKGTVLWVIVDDAEPISTDIVGKDFRDNWTIKKIYPKPVWEKGQNTQGRNITAGLRTIKELLKAEECGAVFIIEDDDYYSPGYLSAMMDRRGGADVWGEMDTVYYNVKARGWLVNRNRQWSSLFQTAFSYGCIDNVVAACGEKFIDLAIFGAWGYDKSENRIKNKKILAYKKPLSIGIKGMPGRKGIGAGHTAGESMEKDPLMGKLNQLIGKDYEAYRRYSDFGSI